VPPLNRPNDVVEVLSGVVDTDAYVAPVNFPFLATGEDGVHILAKGTPLVQVIPFERFDERLEAVVSAEPAEAAAERERVHRNTLAGEGWYRDHARAPR
jgi:hypothetical protein